MWEEGELKHTIQVAIILFPHAMVQSWYVAHCARQYTHLHALMMYLHPHFLCLPHFPTFP